MPSSEVSDQHPYLRPVELPFVLPTNIYGAMLAIWHLRLDHQFRFPLHKGKARDYLRYLAWCATEGRKQYRILRSIAEWDRELACPIALPELADDSWERLVPVVMFLYGVGHSHYTFSGMLKRADVRRNVAISYWRGERHKRHSPPVASWLMEGLSARFGSVEGLVRNIRIPHHDRKKTDQQLYRRFHLRDLEGLGENSGKNPQKKCEADADIKFAHLPKGLSRSPVRVPRTLLPALSAIQSINAMPKEEELSAVTRLIETKRPQIINQGDPFGVNLFGYAHGELGIGEDVRLVGEALRAQDIPFCIVNVKPFKHISQRDRSMAPWVTKVPRFSFNLLCLTGVEQARFLCEKGPDVLGSRYTIGLAPWELPQWPYSCHYVYGVVDEIWGISTYTATAYQKAPHPVRAMSLPVTAGEIEGLGRRDFGLPKKPYLFVFSFDINSSVARKNPEGVIRAFKKAFPTQGAEEVGLVIKVNVVNPELATLGILERVGYYFIKQRSWESVERLAAGDPRIHFIKESMRRPRVMALYNACDCYVSLHRAEGFGRGIAEAILLGKQVISTGYSGNMDFCKEPRVALVRHRLRPLKKGEYFWSDGQNWAEPDLDQAAELMRSVKDSPRDVQDALHDFSPESVGKIYARRLEEIRVGLGI
jgi:hypothetical protein